MATEKNLFSKEFKANFSSQKYQIVRKKATVPTTYYINKPDELQRPWYKEELVLTSAPEDQKKTLFISSSRNLRSTLRSGKKIAKEREFLLVNSQTKEKRWIKESEKRSLEKRGLLA